MITRIPVLLFAALLTTALTACQPQGPDSQDEYDVSFYTPLVVPEHRVHVVTQLDHGDEATRGALSKAHDLALSVGHDARRRVEQASSADEALALAGRALAFVQDNDFRFLTEQLVAIGVLNRLTGEDLTENVAAALNMYSLALVENGHPDLDLVARATERLGERLPQYEREERIARASLNAENWLHKRCVDCAGLDVGDAELRRQLNDQEMQFVTRNAAALH